MDYKLLKYPFTDEAAAHIREIGYSLGAIVSSRGEFYENVRQRARERIIQCMLEGEITRPASPEEAESEAVQRLLQKDYQEGVAEIELLSYPLSRVMLACIDDNFLIRRYALAEAKTSSTDLQRESIQYIVRFARGFDIDARSHGESIEVHFTDYVGPASGIRDPRWKLVNKSLRGGWVELSKREFVRLLEEEIRRHVLQLPREVDPGLCESLEPYLEEIRAVLEDTRGEMTEDLGEVQREGFPPCIDHMIQEVAKGANLAHSARFALTSFLLHVGMSIDEVLGVFAASPDYDEERTRYQVEHIAGAHGGTQYTPPMCTTMNTYGNCIGRNKLCQHINHPLTYYRIKKRDLKKEGSEEDSKEDEVSGDSDNG